MKKAKVDDEGAQPVCEEMQKVQDKIETIEEEFDAKVLELQSQFNEKKRPLYLERNVIIQKLPNFWFQAFVHHRALELMLQPEDEELFKYVSSLMVDEKEDIKTGFRITMTFSENPYFTNKELWKELTFTENNETDITQSGIAWKPGKNPSEHNENNADPGTKRRRAHSTFFTFFETAKKDNIYAANIIKDDLWPNPLRYYTGEADDDEKDEFDSDMDDDDDDEEDDAGSEEGEEGEEDEDAA